MSSEKQSKSEISVDIPTRFGVITLNPFLSWSYNAVSEQPFSLTVYHLDFAIQNQQEQQKRIQQVAQDIETLILQQTQLIDTYINQDFLSQNDWLSEAYLFKFQKDFPLEDFKASFQLRSLSLNYDEDTHQLEKLNVTYLPDKKYAYGFDVTIDGFQSLNQEKAPFVYPGLDYNYEACLQVLKEVNEPKFSLKVIIQLSFMEGCIHQGTLYGASAAISEELMKCIHTCHPEVRFEVVRLLYNLQMGAIETLRYVKPSEITDEWNKKRAEDELKYAQAVKEVFEKHQADWALLANEADLKEIVEEIIKQITQ